MLSERQTGHRATIGWYFGALNHPFRVILSDFAQVASKGRLMRRPSKGLGLRDNRDGKTVFSRAGAPAPRVVCAEEVCQFARTPEFP